MTNPTEPTSSAAPYQPTPYQSVQPLSPSDERLWSTLVHVGGIFLGIWPSLIGYIVLKDRGPFVRQHTTSALNFHITLFIVYVVSGILMLVIVGFFLYFAAAILALVFSIMAAVAANGGFAYKYPLTIEFIK